MRAFWDGGVTRDRTDVPWCRDKKATGLWTINGNIIYAPDWWLDELPGVALDGELWAGVGQFQLVSSAVRLHKPDDRWNKITFVAYDAPTPCEVFAPRVIAEKHCNIAIDFATMKYFQKLYGMQEFCKTRMWKPLRVLDSKDVSPERTAFSYLPQVKFDRDLESFMQELYPALVEEGHEGIMFRKFHSRWTAVRSWDLVKLKPYTDDEAIVIGVQFGRDTDLGGKLCGHLGALICEWNGKTIKFGGMRGIERILTLRNTTNRGSYCVTAFQRDQVAFDYARENQGAEDFTETYARSFPIGSTVTFKYRELTDDGMPKDPRFHRKYESI